MLVKEVKSMTTLNHFDFLKLCIAYGVAGIEEWNKWREEHPDIVPDLNDTELSGAVLRKADLSDTDLLAADLRGADLSDAKLNGADLSDANLSGAKLNRADLSDAKLNGANLDRVDMEEVFLKKAEMWRTNLGRARLVYADLSEADLNGADLSEADLSEANLSEAKLNGADLRWANLSWGYLREANLSDANLVGAQFVETDLTHADLTGCRIYGISVWNVQLEGTIQDNLIITNYDEPEITVDNLEVAQFIYLLLNNKKIRNVIDTIAKKVVLILGRFTPERKRVLDALRDKLREHNYSPVVFDFDPPESQDLTETVSILARLSRFIIADITDPSCIPQELYAVEI